MGKILRYPRPRSLKKIADNLVVLLKWLESKNYDSSTIDYDPHLREYARDQAAGMSLQFPRPLKKGTIEKRLDHAVDFLLWSGARQLRAKPKIPMQHFHRNFDTGQNSRPTAKAGQSRAGRARANPVDLRLPSFAELRKWDAIIRLNQPYEKHLACRTILGTAIRLLEAECLPVDFVPMNPEHWHIENGQVSFMLTEGTKGGRHRLISMPLDLCTRLHRYRLRERVEALTKWIGRHPSQAKPRALFLGSYNGAPLSSQTIRTAFSSHRIYPGWSPHLARHTWACYELLALLSNAVPTHLAASGSVPITWVESQARTLISLIVQPQLGHIDEKTTNIYVRWLAMQLSLPSIFSNWHAALDTPDEQEQG